VSGTAKTVSRRSSPTILRPMSRPSRPRRVRNYRNIRLARLHCLACAERWSFTGANLRCGRCRLACHEECASCD
jgi:hypothetical protein